MKESLHKIECFDRLLPKLLIRAGQDFMDDNCPLIAASISYYVLFSMFPMLILLGWLLGHLLQDVSFQERIMDLIIRYVPVKNIEVEDVLMKEIRTAVESSSRTLGVMSLLGLVWSGSNIFGVIRKSINLAFNMQSQRRYYRKKLLDVFMMFFTGLLFLISVFGTVIFQGVEALSQSVPYFGESIRTLSWRIGSFAIPVMISMLTFLMIYKIYPAAKIRIKDIWPGAVAATILFELAKNLFGLYLRNFARYEAVFGSLAAVLSFLLWVYVSSAILLFGAEIASGYGRLQSKSSQKEC